MLVTGSPEIVFPSGFKKNVIKTTKLFRNMVGHVYTVRGFDKFGHAEFWPKRLHSVWIEPEFLKLRINQKDCSS